MHEPLRASHGLSFSRSCRCPVRPPPIRYLSRTLLRRPPSLRSGSRLAAAPPPGSASLPQDHEHPVNAAPLVSLAPRIIFLYTSPHAPGLHPPHVPRDALPHGGRARRCPPPAPAARRQGLAQDRAPPRRRPAAARRGPARGRRRDAGRAPAGARGVPGLSRGQRGIASPTPPEVQRKRLVGLARQALERALFLDDAPAAVFVLEEEAHDRDPAATLADGVLKAKARALRPPPSSRRSRAPPATAGTPCGR